MKTLICTDGSKSSLYAVKRALPFIKEDSELEIVYVIDNAFLVNLNFINKEKTLKYQQSSAENILNEVSDLVKSLNRKVSKTYCLKGHPSTEIINLCSKIHPDSIIVGTSGKSGIEQWIGSTSRDVIMNSVCPVFVSKKHTKQKIFKKEILVTVNESDCTNNAINKIINSIDLTNASIEIMTVIYGSDSVPSEMVVNSNWLENFLDHERVKAEKILQNASKLFEDNNIKVQNTFYLQGYVAQQIIEYLDDNPKDLVVLGTHGRDDVTSFLLGSVSRRVLDGATSPILIVPNKN